MRRRSVVSEIPWIRATYRLELQVALVVMPARHELLKLVIANLAMGPKFLSHILRSVSARTAVRRRCGAVHCRRDRAARGAASADAGAVYDGTTTVPADGSLRRAEVLRRRRVLRLEYVGMIYSGTI